MTTKTETPAKTIKLYVTMLGEPAEQHVVTVSGPAPELMAHLIAMALERQCGLHARAAAEHSG